MIRLRALGQCVVEVGDHQITPESDVLFALLLFLSMSAGRAVPRAELLDLLWPDSAPRNARHRLRQALYQLKKLGAPLGTLDSFVNLREADVEVDYVLGARSRQALTRSVAETSPLDFLPHYTPTFSEPFARWVESERDRVRGSLRRYLLEVVADARLRGDHAAIVVLARACLDLDPLNGDDSTATGSGVVNGVANPSCSFRTITRALQVVGGFASAGTQIVVVGRNGQTVTLDASEQYESDATPIKPQRLMHELSRRFPPSTRFLADAGNSMTWAVHYLQPRNRRTTRSADRVLDPNGVHLAEPERPPWRRARNRRGRTAVRTPRGRATRGGRPWPEITAPGSGRDPVHPRPLGDRVRRGRRPAGPRLGAPARPPS